MLNLDIQKSFYQKTKVQEDGITHIVDTEHEYPMYAVQLFGWYKDIDNKDELIDQIKKDLQSTLESLDKMKESKPKEREIGDD